MGENCKIYVWYNKFIDLFFESVVVDLVEINKNIYIFVIFKVVYIFGFLKDKLMYVVS